jgi:transposase
MGGGSAVEVVRHPPKSRYVRVKEVEEPDRGKLRTLLPPPGFGVLPRRWVVERTFSLIDQNRRMSKDYEKLAETDEAFVLVATPRLMARRLGRS